MGNFKNDFEDHCCNEFDCSDRDDCCGSCHICGDRYNAMVDEAERKIEEQKEEATA